MEVNMHAYNGFTTLTSSSFFIYFALSSRLLLDTNKPGLYIYLLLDSITKTTLALHACNMYSSLSRLILTLVWDTNCMGWRHLRRLGWISAFLPLYILLIGIIGTQVRWHVIRLPFVKSERNLW